MSTAGRAPRSARVPLEPLLERTPHSHQADGGVGRRPGSLPYRRTTAVSLAGRVALVTGAGRGIGQTIARLLAERGMSVAVNDASHTALADTAFAALAIPADVTSKAQVASMIERVESTLGPLWLLVNNAGVYHSAPTAELSEEAWDQDFAVDAK